jgi:hypothetical protein
MKTNYLSLVKLVLVFLIPLFFNFTCKKSHTDLNIQNKISEPIHIDSIYGYHKNGVWCEHITKTIKNDSIYVYGVKTAMDSLIQLNIQEYNLSYSIVRTKEQKTIHLSKRKVLQFHSKPIKIK